MTTIQEFAQGEQTRLDAEKEARMNEMGYKPFLKIADMETVRLLMSDDLPRDNTKYPGRKVFRVQKGWTEGIEKEELDWSIAQNTPLYREVIAHIAAGEMMLDVTRVGTSRDDTRYKVVAVKA